MMIGLFTGLSLVVLSACGSNTMDGDYTGTLQFLWIESDVTMRFEDDRVSFRGNQNIENDEFDLENLDHGTYEIEDDELIITVDGYSIRGNLSDDRESFIVTEDDAGVYSGITFLKEDE
ncbi:MAG: hypothetical protein L0J63_13575 [Tetragenococcus koreensis]|nr:hypothetical protein [Tetragenococcus koreensis]